MSTARPGVTHRFLRDKKAATAVEFALLGAAFFLFIFGIFVVSLDQFLQMTLDDSVRNAAREVEIGQITDGGDFLTAVCNEFGIAAPYCTSTLQYSVQTSGYFGGITPATLSAGGTLSPGNTFQVLNSTLPIPPTPSSAGVPGAAQFLLVQVAYPLPFKILAVPGGVATENGTPSLLSTVASAME